MVRLPDAVGAAGQVRNAPLKVIRGFFAGIGQLLIAADRFRAEEAERERAADGDSHDPLTGPDGQRAAAAPVTGEAAEPAQAGQPGVAGPAAAATQPAGRTAAAKNRTGRAAQPPARTRFRSLDSTGNVRLLAPDEAAARPAGSGPAKAPAPAKPARAKPAPAKPAPARPAPARAEPSSPAEPVPSAAAAADGLPVPGYDGLSLPSLRSRLRALDLPQLRVLADYERAHARRQDVITMFERRIAKLEAAAADAS